MTTQTLDVTGLKCPLPILKAKKALAQMQAGDVLTVLATDAGAPDDFAAFCRQTGHQLLESAQENSCFRLVVQHK
ncbi:MAG: sulfurtransferase TusA family protein [Neisseria sp.]|nr:sulfurtransferase TusA family protein [Neisseria sp.]